MQDQPGRPGNAPALTPRGAFRRRLAIGVVALSGLPAGFLWWRRRVPPPTLESMFALVADRLLPASADNPGAVALGLVPRILAGLNRGTGSDQQQSLLQEALDQLIETGFHDMDPDARDAYLEPIIQGRVAGPAAILIQRFFNRLIRVYYAREESWAAIGYRRPQPLGYPEYTTCGSRLGKSA